MRLLALGIVAPVYAGAYGIYLWLPQIVQAMGYSNAATGFVVAWCYVAGIPVMMLVGRSSSRRDERIRHVALPCLLAAASLAVASPSKSDAVSLVAFALALVGNFAGFGPCFSLPPSFLRGTVAVSGIGSSAPSAMSVHSWDRS